MADLVPAKATKKASTAEKIVSWATLVGVLGVLSTWLGFHRELDPLWWTLWLGGMLGQSVVRRRKTDAALAMWRSRPLPEGVPRELSLPVEAPPFPGSVRGQRAFGLLLAALSPAPLGFALLVFAGTPQMAPSPWVGTLLLLAVAAVVAAAVWFLRVPAGPTLRLSDGELRVGEIAFPLGAGADTRLDLLSRARVRISGGGRQASIAANRYAYGDGPALLAMAASRAGAGDARAWLLERGRLSLGAPPYDAMPSPIVLIGIAFLAMMSLMIVLGGINALVGNRLLHMHVH